MITAGILCIAVCAGLVSGNLRENRQAAESSGRRLSAVREHISENMQSENENTDEITPLPYTAEEKEMPVEEVGGEDYIGILSIPALELEMPVTSECSLYTLRDTIGRYYGSVRTGDLVIAGHNYQSGFGRLRQLTPGDILTFTEMDGEQHSYTVGELEILEPGDVEDMIQSSYELSLYTCTYTGRQRFTVRCKEDKKN